MRVLVSSLGDAADAHLWVHASGVTFELRLRVDVLEPARPPGGEAKALPEGLVFVCCDDDEVPRIFFAMLLRMAGADESESAVLGETADEVGGLVERVLSLSNALGDDRVVCIIDQNLDYDEHGAFQGTALARELRRRGFGGLFVVQSANDSQSDAQTYLEAGADGSMGKAIKDGARGMLGVVGSLWHAKFGEGGAA